LKGINTVEEVLWVSNKQGNSGTQAEIIYEKEH